ncbi:MAG: SRPBCC family protein [Kofleriaceae bacterium]
MRTLEPVDLDFFATAPFRICETLHLRASPEAVFAAFADAPMWTRWWPLMHEARWTKGTGGLGDERSVSLRALGRFDERFIAWTPGAHFAFSMIATTSPLVKRMGEDYRLTPDGKGTRLVWTIAAVPSALGRASTPVTRFISKRMIRRGIPKLDRLLSAN